MIQTATTAAGARTKLDPRLYQIFTLASLLGYGMLALDFEIAGDRAATMRAPGRSSGFDARRLVAFPSETLTGSRAIRDPRDAGSRLDPCRASTYPSSVKAFQSGAPFDYWLVVN